MKKIILLFTLFTVLFTKNQTYAQQLQPIPDTNLRNYLQSKFPECFSGNLLDVSCEKVIHVYELDVSNLGISDLTGIRFFKSLQFLKCAKNNLTTLDGLLPDSLRLIDCTKNQLTSLPVLPDSLNTLFCSNNLLTVLPAFPIRMDILHCSNNKLTQLPNLPNTFSILSADSNMIASLPPIPDSLHYISLVRNELSVFPAVSITANKIFYIDVSYNKITQVSTLPSSLEFLNAGNNLITELPVLPAGLQSLGCSNNQITCLPFLPLGLKWLGFSNTLITCIPNLPLTLRYFNGTTTLICTAANTSQNNCTYYVPASGIVYVDYNGNTIQDPGETGVADILIFANNNTLPRTFTDGMGKYTLYLPAGTYGYRAAVTDTLFTSTTVRAIKIIDGVSNSDAYDFGLIPTKEIKDITVSTTALVRPRPGFPASFIITCINSGNFPVTNAELRFSYASPFSYQSTSLAYTTHQDTILKWNIPVLNPGEKKNISVEFTLPSSTPLGTLLPTIAVFKPINKGDTTRNYSFLHEQARGSYDPNDKNVLPAGNVTPEFIAKQENLEYTIRFQNTGTADAINVIVTDTINSKLDIETLTMISASHTYRYEQRGNKAVWIFENIHLPDMHTNEAESHGYIKFSIKPMPDLALGDVIKNRAGIVFDFNESIITNSTETLIAIPPVTSIYSQTEQSIKLNVYPNPSADKAYITFNNPEYAGNASVVIRNNLGQEVIAHSVVLIKGVNKLELDVHALHAGIYYIEIKYDTKSYGAKLLKQ